jgi:glycosyltransferase involved in cell wall biosynthesis
MKVGLILYGSLDTLSGGYLYDRKLVESLRNEGESVEVISLPWRNYPAHLTDNFHFKLPKNMDILIQDELNHPSLISANRGTHPYPILSLVHHLRCSERRPAWQNIFYGWIETQYLRSVDGFIYNSGTTQRVVNGLLKDGKPGIIAFPPTDRFGSAIPERQIIERAGSNPFRILFLGNVIERKGLHTLLRAVNTPTMAYQVDVVGSLTSEPAYARKIQKYISENHIRSSVFLHGPLDREPLIEKLTRAHVLAVPSSYEGFGIVYLEGMCFGLPAVGTNTGAAREVIEHGKTGFLIDTQDSTSLARHLRSLAEDRGLLARLSLNARERYLRQPSWEETAKNIRGFLYEMIGQPR